MYLDIHTPVVRFGIHTLDNEYGPHNYGIVENGTILNDRHTKRQKIRNLLVLGPSQC